MGEECQMVNMEIIKVGGARPVAWRWYRKNGRNASIDYCVGRNEGEVFFCVKGLRISRYPSPGMPTGVWVPLSVLAPILNRIPSKEGGAVTGAVLRSVLPRSRNNQARYIAVLRAEKFLIECLARPTNLACADGGRGGFASVRNHDLAISKYRRQMLARKPTHRKFEQVPVDQIWRP